MSVTLNISLLLIQKIDSEFSRHDDYSLGWHCSGACMHAHVCVCTRVGL